MYIGRPTLCYKTKNLAASSLFYQTLGMQVLEEKPGQRVVLQSGHLTIALMPFLEGNLLNLRGGDAFEIYQTMKSSGLDVQGIPEHYRKDQYDADADGDCWLTSDADGNAVLFDTNQLERSESARALAVRKLLENTELALIAMGADADCINALRREVINKYCKEGPV